MVYALVIFIAGQLSVSWFDSRKNCLQAASEIAGEVDLSTGEDEISCIAYEVTEERKS